MIILIGGEKGGTGKTTIATNLAAMHKNRRNDVLLIDTDRQSSASDWARMRDEKCSKYSRVACVQKFDKGITSEVRELNKFYKDIIIDAGGRDSIELRSSLLVADLAIFPIRASQFDLWTLTRLNELVETAILYNEKLIARILINQAHPNPKITEVLEAEDYIKSFRFLALLEPKLCERIIYRHASIQGLCVEEVNCADKGAWEFSNVYNEVFNGGC